MAARTPEYVLLFGGRIEVEVLIEVTEERGDLDINVIGHHPVRGAMTDWSYKSFTDNRERALCQEAAEQDSDIIARCEIALHEAREMAA